MGKITVITPTIILILPILVYRLIFKHFIVVVDMCRIVWKKHKVVNSVVRSVSVYVVYYFTFLKLSTQMPFHYKPVFITPFFYSHPDSNIPFFVQLFAAFPFWVSAAYILICLSLRKLFSVFPRKFFSPTPNLQNTLLVKPFQGFSLFFNSFFRSFFAQPIRFINTFFSSFMVTLGGAIFLSFFMCLLKLRFTNFALSRYTV